MGTDTGLRIGTIHIGAIPRRSPQSLAKVQNAKSFLDSAPHNLPSVRYVRMKRFNSQVMS